MYIRVTNPKFLELGDSGRPAAGYLVYTLVAGTVDTLLTTYSNKELTSANTNPIVLDALGECDIFVSGDVKLVYTEPTGDLSSPIWTEDHVAEQQGIVSDKGDGVYVSNNNYTLDTVPTYTSIPDGFSLVMVPDTTCLGTLVIPVGATKPTVFTGTGINDGVFSGRYVGSTAGAEFAVTIDTCYVSEPATACTAAVSADVGATPPTAGVHLVAITYITAEGETLIGPTATVTADGVHKIDLAAIPTGPTGKGITSRKIYMTEAAGSDFYYVDELADVVTVVYKVDLTDVTLAGNAAAPTANDTGSGTGYDTFSWQIDAGAATAGVPITGVAQTLQDGLFITFANRTGHTLTDVWTVEVMTPVRLNFCGLGSDLVYKNEDGALAVLDAADIVADYPAHLDYSLSQSCWILLNPSLPVLESVIPLRTRKEVTGNYTIDETADQGTEINVTGTYTVTLPDAVDAASHFFYIRNNGPGVVTVDAGTYLIKDVLNGDGSTTVILGIGQAIQIATNGVDWHILTGTGFPTLIEGVDLSADASYVFSVGIGTGFVYKLEYELTTSGNARLLVRFNADSGNNYVSQYSWIDALGNPDSDISLIDSAMLGYNTAGSFMHGECKIKQIDGTTNVSVLGSAYATVAAGIANFTCGGVYTGALALSSITILPDAGTLTGRVNLYRIA